MKRKQYVSPFIKEIKIQSENIMNASPDYYKKVDVKNSLDDLSEYYDEDGYLWSD